ncbi:uncharacterized protein PG998_004712 [Apiospora kogelbergensis]|uniref:uncharacterized protein n=1 Tax=Apiospora kogelbergensis TaxID=1337665 RepID=UPI0031322DAF
MRILSILFTILCSAAIYNLRSMLQELEEAQSHNEGSNAANRVSIYEKDVLATTMYALGSGLAVNVVCAFAARPLDPEIIPGTEMMACAPYGIGAAALAARLHTFSLGGWTAEHWVYARRTGPAQLKSWLRKDVVGRLVRDGKRLMTGKGMPMGMATAGCSGDAEEDSKCEL